MSSNWELYESAGNINLKIRNLRQRSVEASNLRPPRAKGHGLIEAIGGCSQARRSHSPLNSRFQDTESLLSVNCYVYLDHHGD